MCVCARLCAVARRTCVRVPRQPLLPAHALFRLFPSVSAARPGACPLCPPCHRACCRHFYRYDTSIAIHTTFKDPSPIHSLPSVHQPWKRFYPVRKKPISWECNKHKTPPNNSSWLSTWSLFYDKTPVAFWTNNEFSYLATRGVKINKTGLIIMSLCWQHYNFPLPIHSMSMILELCYGISLLVQFWHFVLWRCIFIFLLSIWWNA